MKEEVVYILMNAILFQAIGGLGIFLLGLKFMSEGMQAIAGNRLRKLIGAVTNNRIIACGVGTLVTCLVQSSSVTTVMVVGFVNSGFMTLMQAIGVILGANIGTTITGWILALEIGKFGLPMLGISTFVYLFSKSERARYIAMTIMGIGMIFFGLETMAAGFKNPEVKEALKAVFTGMSGQTYVGVLKCAVVGCLATMIIQSSSATLGITIAMAQTGILDFETAMALIMGLNIGTTITAYLASIGATTNAKRAAYAHIIFNIAGTIWLFPIFYYYCKIISQIGDLFGSEITARIALAHTAFNIINTIVFLPLMGLLAKAVIAIAPDKPHKEALRLTVLDVRMLDTPAIAIKQSQEEIVRMSEHVRKMLSYLGEIVTSKDADEEKEKKVFHREEVLDIMQKEVTEFLCQILSGSIPHDVVREGRKQLRMADEYESIGDYIANILKLHLKMQHAGLAPSDEGRKEILELHDHVCNYTGMVNDAVRQNNIQIVSKAHTQGEAITHMMKESRTKHLERVGAGSVSPLSSLIFTDILTSYRRIKDHVLNIAEALAGEK